MAETLKDRFFTQEFWDELQVRLELFVPELRNESLQQQVCDQNWSQLELKQRVRRVAVVLRPYLPASYLGALEKLVAFASHMRTNHKGQIGFGYLFLADFIEEFGLAHWQESMDAMPIVTQVMSCEFAIRPFLLQYRMETLTKMHAWASHPNEHVRRLASEGCRPRLPWGSALAFLKNDPSAILPILELLKSDPSEYVRRSVANNLNDISKDHPGLVLELAEEWIGKTGATDRLLKHALRGLLKAGNVQALSLFGFVALTGITIQKLACQREVQIGGDWEFSFELVVAEKATQQLRLEFGIDYMKANGKSNRKIFQIKEANFSSGVYFMTKRHSFLERTTRKHHLGKHAVAVLVNGIELGTIGFLVE